MLLMGSTTRNSQWREENERDVDERFTVNVDVRHVR